MWQKSLQIWNISNLELFLIFFVTKKSANFYMQASFSPLRSVISWCSAEGRAPNYFFWIFFDKKVCKIGVFGSKFFLIICDKKVCRILVFWNIIYIFNFCDKKVCKIGLLGSEIFFLIYCDKKVCWILVSSSKFFLIFVTKKSAKSFFFLPLSPGISWCSAEGRAPNE